MIRSESPSEAVWPTAPASLSIDSGDLQIWRARLEASEDQVAAARSLLSTDELARADRFFRAEHRRRFAIGRAVLRRMLGSYLGEDPAAIVFSYNELGKPYRDAQGAGERIEFNVSHSGELALYAFSTSSPVGVDIERTRSNLETEKIARRFFSPGEVEALLALPKDERVQGFYNCWTRKEAFVKAKGLGFALRLSDFEVRLAPGEPAELVSFAGDEGSFSWKIFDLRPGPGYTAAAVMTGTPKGCTCWQFE